MTRRFNLHISIVYFRERNALCKATLLNINMEITHKEIILRKPVKVGGSFSYERSLAVM